MATANKNLSIVGSVPKAKEAWNIAIVKAEWNEEITNGLLEGAKTLLKESDIPESNIHLLGRSG